MVVVPGCRHRAHWCNGGQSDTGGAGALVQCVLWCTVHNHSGAMCPPPGAPDWRDTRVGRRVNMYSPDLAPHGDDAADCDKRIRLFLGRSQLRGGGAWTYSISSYVHSSYHIPHLILL